MEEIIQFDKQLLLMVNGSDSVFLDYVVLTLTNAKTWQEPSTIPLSNRW